MGQRTQGAVQRAPQQVGPPGLVVDVADQRVLDRDPAAGQVGVVAGRVECLGDLPSLIHRHQGVPQFVIGGV